MKGELGMKRTTGWQTAIVGSTLCLLLLSSSAWAHHPDLENQPVHPRFRTPTTLLDYWPGYRERYNRPSYLGGKIAYWISPTSQEAMSWHRSVHRGYYANHAPRMEDRYYYPKPWEALQVGSRTPVDRSPAATAEFPDKANLSDRPQTSSPDVLPAPTNKTAEPERLPVPER